MRANVKVIEGVSNAVFQLAVVVGCVWRVLLVEEEERRFIRPVLRRGGVRSQVCDGGFGGSGGSVLIQANHVMSALWGLGCAVQTRCHQAILVLGPSDLQEKADKGEIQTDEPNRLQLKFACFLAECQSYV